MTIDLSTPSRKRRFNEDHFTVSAPRYDLATRLMSLGQDNQWKKTLLSMIPKFGQPRCLDLACGTGQITFLLAEKFPEAIIEGLDITSSMLHVARQKNRFLNVTFKRKEMCPLDYPDESFDLVTGGYALRNAPYLESALNEIYRVLKPGGIGAFLDFSKPADHRQQKIQNGVLKLWGGFWGWVLHGDARIHGYISESLKDYPDRNRLDGLFTQAGFEIVNRRRFLLGMTEAVILRKPAV